MTRLMPKLSHAIFAACLPLGAGGAAGQEVGARLYATHCAVCHGVDGTGGGPMAEVLLIPPPDLTEIAARRDGVFPRIRIARLIDGRDPLLTHGGEMPVFGFVFSEFSEVLRDPGGATLLTSPEVVRLVDWLETVQR